MFKSFRAEHPTFLPLLFCGQKHIWVNARRQQQTNPSHPFPVCQACFSTAEEQQGSEEQGLFKVSYRDVRPFLKSYFCRNHRRQHPQNIRLRITRPSVPQHRLLRDSAPARMQCSTRTSGVQHSAGAGHALTTERILKG